MQHTYGARLERLLIKPLEEEELELLRKWRNDNDISRYLRKIGFIDPKQQIEWFKRYLYQPDIYYWAIVEDEKVIGSLSIYNIQDQRAEIGKIMIGAPNARGKGYGYHSLIMAMKIGFDLLNLRAFYLRVDIRNIAAIKTYKRAAFQIIGTRMKDEDVIEHEMELKQERYVEVNPMSNDIVLYPVRGGYHRVDKIMYPAIFESALLEVA